MGMAMRALIVALLFLTAGSAADSSATQVYKWVDERGVLNYSNLLPVNPGSASKPVVVEDRVSVYTPDPALVQAIAALRWGGGAAARIAELERQLAAERQARQVAAVATTPRPSDLCTGVANCGDLSSVYYPVYPYYARTIVAPPRFRPPHAQHPGPLPRPPIAGNGSRPRAFNPGHFAPRPASSAGRPHRPER